jgi:predicted unusual protein kinase regulating ubiquinone biosynthesis (AarF/ABC1/UbiB family)
MPFLPLKPNRLKRYKDIAHLLIKHGRADLLQVSDLEQAFLQEELREGQTTDGDPEQLVRDLEALGPTFVKLGQLLSTRPDLLPQPYVDALSRLQDEVTPFPYEQVEEIIWDELGLRVSGAFNSFDPDPLAAASLGQVHRAQLRDGRLVAVKVQRPGIRRAILADLDAFTEIASTIDQYTDIGRRYAFQDMMEEFRSTLLQELDYRREAQNLEKMGQALKNYDSIVVPQPVETYTCSRVLTMKFIQGLKIDALSPDTLSEFEGQALAKELSKAYLDNILLDGFFHADPHPGNIFITPERKLALLDLGMVARVDPSLQENLLKLVLAVNEGNGREVARLSMKIGTPLEDRDEARFTRQVSNLVGFFQETTLEYARLGRIVMELARISAGNGVRPAPELTVVGKTLLNLDAIGRNLDPTFNPNLVVRRHIQSIMWRHLLKNLSPGNLLYPILEITEFIQELPGRANILLEGLTQREFEIKVQAVDETRLMNNLQKIANRITLGLVLAALIVGAALIMRIESSVTIFGYPALAIGLFLLAAGLGLVLVFNIFVQDIWGPHG